MPGNKRASNRPKHPEHRKRGTIKTLTELARALGVTPATITKWTNRPDWPFKFPLDASAVIEWRSVGPGSKPNPAIYGRGAISKAPTPAEDRHAASMRGLKLEEQKWKVEKLKADTESTNLRSRNRSNGQVSRATHEQMIAALAEQVKLAARDMVDVLPALLHGEPRDRMKAIIEGRFVAFVARLARVDTVNLPDGAGTNKLAKRAAAKRYKRTAKK